MINDILDFSQITNGRLRLNSTTFDVVESVKEVTKLIKFQAKRKGLRFEFINKFQDNIGKVLFQSDPNRVKQVVLNLLGNALKFTEKGFIRITVEPGEERPMSNCDLDILSNYYNNNKICSVKFTVQDTGCGIKSEDIPKLFQLFAKLETQESKKVNQTGVGLGLAISQSLVRRLNKEKPGEEIKVLSELGKGSCFYFTLRSLMLTEVNSESIRNIVSSNLRLKSTVNFAEEDEGIRKISLPKTPMMKKVRSMSTSNASLPTNEILPKTLKKVLVVDDDQINIMVLSAYLKSFEDCKFNVALNGLEAVELVKRQAKEFYYFDIIFMDCNMPVMDGFEATRTILQMVKSKEIPSLPIIASTANASQPDYEMCFKCGMVDYLAKTYGKALLRDKLDKFT
jgi:two-component system, sensor histidine kinase